MQKKEKLDKNSKPSTQSSIKTQRFQMPESMTTQLNEFTKGYALVYINDNGMPCFSGQFDGNLATALGFSSLLRDYADYIEDGGLVKNNESRYSDEDDLQE